jgi:hypothetical protein
VDTSTCFLGHSSARSPDLIVFGQTIVADRQKSVHRWYAEDQPFIDRRQARGPAPAISSSRTALRSLDLFMDEHPSLVGLVI